MKLNSSLIALFATVAVGMTITACSNADDIATSQESNIINYAPAKASKIQITSGDAVLGTTVTSRGIDLNSNQWDSIPSYPSQAEIDGVMAYIATKPEGVDWPGYTSYLIQHVSGAHHMYTYYDMNGATLTVDGTQSMEQLTVLENSGNWQTVNNFNAGKGNNNASHDCVHMTDGFNGASALSEWSGSTISAWRLFYWEGNYYLGMDYHMQKGDGQVEPDGCYDDWVVKIIPICGEKRVYINAKTSDPTDPADTDDDTTDDDTTDPVNGMVEVNLALNEQKVTDDYISSKLSIHVRDTTDVEIFMPVSADLYCQADDMYILKNHVEGNWVYNETKEEVSMEVAGQTVTLTCYYGENGITIKTSGINAAVLKELREKYHDGINFEIWNYYDISTDRITVQRLLNNSTCKCTTAEYLNTVLNDDTYNLDCIVKKAE